MQQIQQLSNAHAAGLPTRNASVSVRGLDLSISLVDLIVLALVSLVLITILISLIIS